MKNCIFYCVYGDQKYYDLLKLSLESLKDNFTDEDVFVFTDTYTKELEKFSFCKQIVENFPEGAALSIGYRLILGQRLLNDYNNILYIDTDTIITKNVSNIFKVIEDGKISFASEKVNDPYKITFEAHAGPLMTEEEKEIYKDVNSFCAGIFAGNKTIQNELNLIYNYIIEIDNTGFRGICGDQHAFIYYLLKHNLYNYNLQKFINGDAFQNNYYFEKQYTIQHFAWNDTIEVKIHKMKTFYNFYKNYKRVKQKIKNRNILLDFFPKNSKVAELGVFCGEFSKILKDKLSPKELFLVDLFPSSAWSGDKDGQNMSNVNLEPVYKKLISQYQDDSTIKIVKQSSQEFLESLPDEYLDIVYIDADHSYEGVKKDLNLCLKKVKKGGIIAGHDYIPVEKIDYVNGVIKAVNEFCYENKLQISFITKDGCPSFAIYNKPIKRKVTLVTACKDRNECLQAVLPSWLQHKEITEIIIVDWSSENSLEHLIHLDDRIKVVRVENEKYYIPSQANNLAASFATNDYILRIDTDYFLNPYYNFFDLYQIDETNFVSGEPENHNDRINNPYYMYLYGLLYISKENFYKVNGYNEHIGYFYSYEDGDIFDRLKLLGLEQIKLQNNHSVIHIPHSDKKRFEHFEGFQNYNADEHTVVNAHISINQQTYKDPKEYFVSSKINWEINQVSERYFIAVKGKNIFDGLPKINCISLEESKQRRKTLINSFKKYNINDINFLLSKRYSKSTDKIEGKLVHTLNEGTAGCCVSHLKNIKQWLETSNEEYGFFCEDDLSLETAQYWDKTWKEFIEGLPQDWECVQLLTIRKDKLSLSVRDRIWDDWSATAYILKRSYAEKIINNYCIEDTFKLELPEPNSETQPLIENLLFTIGKTYTVSLFVENINFESTFVETDTDVDAATLHKNNHVIAAQKTLELWKSKAIAKQATIKELYNFSTNIDDPECNFKMGEYYFNQGHTAPALSYFLRCAERTEDKNLAYEALIYGYMCYREQKIRDETAKSLIMHAVCLLPERPEARWILSVFFEQRSEWMYAYYHACRGLETCEQEFVPLKHYKEYPGKQGLLFQKAIVGYWWGKNDECKEILLDLYNNPELTDTYKQSVKENLERIGVKLT